MRSTGADILVVDDEADIRELVSGLLEDEGHAVRVAANSDEALAAIRARKPSLALLDIWMAGRRVWTGWSCWTSSRSWILICRS